MAAILKHTPTPHFAVMSVEEWVANRTIAHELSYDVWVAGDAKGANAPRLWFSMVRMTNELDMRLSAAMYRGTSCRLEPRDNIMRTFRSRVLAMVRHIRLKITPKGCPTPLGEGDDEGLMLNGCGSSMGGIDVLLSQKLGHGCLLHTCVGGRGVGYGPA